MKFKVLVLITYLSSSFSFANADKLDEKKDFSIICAISKAGESLSKDKYFADKAEKALLISGMLEKNLRTDEVKNILRTVMVADSEHKVELLKRGAADAGLKSWKCASLKFLF